MRALIDLLRAMTPRERRRAGLIGAGLALAALLEVVGVASVVPFLTLVGDPAAASRIPALGAIRDGLGLADDRGFLIVVGLGALSAILVTSCVNAGLTYAQLRFSHAVGYGFARRLLFRTVDRERLFFSTANSAELAKTILSETDRLVVGVLTPATVIASRATSATAVIVFLLVVSPRLALILGAGFGGLYVGIFLVVRARLARIGARAVAGNEGRFRVVHETIGGLTELKLYGRAETFASRFEAPARAYAQASAESLLTGQLPRFVIEALAFGGVIVVVLFALSQGLDTAGLLPLLGLFAFAGYRMLPAFQNVFNALALLRFTLPAVRLVVDGLAGEREPVRRNSERLPFRDAIRLERVGFDYEPGRPALSGIDLVIPAHATVGLVGRTGSGKSTLIGLILGFLTPTTGRLAVDGVALDATTLPAWQNRIGYVPQDIFLVDGTIADNIAFGLDAIDDAAVERAARLAGAHDFVVALPEGYATRVGERGARLSGGQRQRIGIARALYHDPDVIVFDEATSALDEETEGVVMRAVQGLAGTRTLIMIAHRLTSLAGADTVHVLEGGRIVASGPPGEVLPQVSRAEPLLDLE
ncbi:MULTISPECIES: ABC transporter ATP-binding protein [Methylobacterium]|jgi:ABC-type multidrug transport system fused ATPase/permease subunit|uniref:ABC transporter ATP-binding protein n=1 Tax=Methylobacterium TaxID=407 RepID=UPI0008E47466|nr:MULTISPECIES: ABC transporter ATP-binding protein [Methylobacterium]MBZ6414363.1 ABC transporter ATP-binding protein/permease [Methylobacterium sp.]MBK3398784.1 ABC transporter ATP-binding protein [Methylobacterium ajmalii]MBK3409554.1 ABC transporter ATP-binding protein [Methylobacterium ajmalii]MBK3421583.1 ABC transporter ATP-binding protein [Methylobacterium ajmalii]SFE14436.1 ABC-type multidrug transport system, ATPase and permease component [Methylobacterium sp. yr596]